MNELLDKNGTLVSVGDTVKIDGCDRLWSVMVIYQVPQEMVVFMKCPGDPRAFLLIDIDRTETITGFPWTTEKVTV